MNQRVIVLIQARLTSSRFPNKILQELYGQLNSIDVIYQRLQRSTVINEIRFCIPDTSDNDSLESFLIDSAYPYSRGSENDLISRYLDSTSDLLSEDLIVRITSDCPLVDPSWVDHAVNVLIDKNADYCSNYTPAASSFFCNGSDIEVFPKRILEKLSATFLEPKDREHVTFPLWDGRLKNHHVRIMPRDSSDFSDVRITLDYLEDLLVIRKILQYYGGIYPSLETIIDIYRRLNLRELNGMHHYAEGW